MTNMLRTYGTKDALLTLLGDMAKSALSVLIGRIILGEEGAYIAGLLCILGHIFPCYFKCKGGKGVVATATMVLFIDPIVFATLLAIFIIVVAISRYVSLASVICGFCYPAIVYIRMVALLEKPVFIPFFFAVLIGALLIYMHRENIKRLYNRQESKIVFSKKSKKAILNRF